MSEETKKVNNNFLALVFSISANAWQQLGKLKNPLTDKTEKNLEHAKISIDILEMLKEKTKNNLTPEEEKLLISTLTDLQLNYVEELKKENIEKPS